MNVMSPVAIPNAPVLRASPVIAVAYQLLVLLERGQRINSAALRAAMETAFEASDASGAWNWKTAYEACECAIVLFLRKYGRALFRKADTTIFVVQELLTEDGRRGFWADRGTFAVVADALAALDTLAADPTMIESARALNRRTGEILEFRIGSSRA